MGWLVSVFFVRALVGECCFAHVAVDALHCQRIVCAFLVVLSSLGLSLSLITIPSGPRPRPRPTLRHVTSRSCLNQTAQFEKRVVFSINNIHFKYMALCYTTLACLLQSISTKMYQVVSSFPSEAAQTCSPSSRLCPPSVERTSSQPFILHCISHLNFGNKSSSLE